MCLTSDNKIKISVAHPDVLTRWTPPEDLQMEIRDKLLEEKAKLQRKTSFKRKLPTYSVGEIVFMKKAPEVTGETKKLQSKYRGPMVINEILPSSTYRVSDIEEVNGYMYATTAHASQLKGWKCPDSDDEDANNQEDEEIAEEEDPKSLSDQGDFLGFEANEVTGFNNKLVKEGEDVSRKSARSGRSTKQDDFVY